MRRREFLQSAVAGVVGVGSGAWLASCLSSPSSAQPTPPATTDGQSKALLVYFSRPGENYYYGKRTQLKVGNTEVLANMIRRFIACDVYRIVPATPYSDDYVATVARNVREQEGNIHPAIAKPLPSLKPYKTILLGSPIWNVRAPMIMSTFAEALDFTGKTVIPFTTYAMSGLGTTIRDYTTLCPGATMGEGLAVRGEEVEKSRAVVEAWLRRIKLLTK